MKRILVLSVCMLGCAPGVHAETCVKTTFNVTYGCGNGTVAGTLPADAVAEYNKSFSPTSLTTSYCTPPDGYEIKGMSVYINDTEMAYITGSFTYSFAADSEIRPNYVRGSDIATIATLDTLAASLNVGGTSYTYDKTAQTWSVVFSYGTVNGVAKCSTIMPANAASGYDTGLVASDQDAIENAAAGGMYCYCKMTEPYIAASPWVFTYRGGSVSNCASACADRCGTYVRGYPVFRASVFAAAGN